VTNGVALSAAISPNPPSIDGAGGCGAAGNTASGWQMKTITRAAAGLPAAIATPLTLK
jgi:hypothetical protein